MSAPSKEEAIEARIKRARGPMPDICDKTIAALADENERLRAELNAQLIDYRKETDRLRSEMDQMLTDALVRQTTEITLRAERAECLALLEKVEEICAMRTRPSADVWPTWFLKAIGPIIQKMRGQP